MKALFLVPTVLAMQVTEDHGGAMNLKGDIEGMKELFLSVSKSKIDGATRQAVAAMMKEITGTLTNAVAEDMQFHKDTLDCKYAEILECAEVRTKFATNHDIVGLKNASGEAKVDHRDCRKTEQTECDDRNTLKDTCDSQVSAMSKCARHREHWETNSATVKKWMLCLDAQKSAAQALITTHENYEKKCKQQCATRETCNTDQTDFEVKMCNWMTKVDEMCYDYDVCYADEVERYATSKTNALEAWAVAKQQMMALTILKCYGNSILDNRTSLDHCNGIACDGCPISPCDASDDHCLEKPAPVPCDERTRPCDVGRELLPRPCEQTFLDEQYNQQGMAQDTCTPAIECTTCHDYHTHPMYFAGRGQCYCDVGGTKDDLVGTPPAMDSAIACTDWCRNDDEYCRYASWNADTHECVGLRNMNSQTQERPTAWSCYSKYSRDRVEED